MQDSRGQIIKLSDQASFTVSSGATEDKRQINYYYNDPAKLHGDNVMLVIFPENPFPNEPFPIEIPMIYDEVHKRYAANFDRPKDVGEMFLITTAKEPGKKENEAAPVLQQGFVALKDGKQQPVNRMPGISEGKLETFLLTKGGQIQKPSSMDAATLKEGERFVQVYVPPGYDSNRKPPYKLQITLDGRQYLFPMQMNVVLDNLIEAKQIEPVVVVFISPDSGPPKEEGKGFGIVMPKGYPLSMRLKEYCCNPEFADMLAEIPTSLREQFNVTNDPKNTTIWGVSAGGLQAVYTGLLHPNVFGNVVAESPMAWNIPEQNGKDWRKGIVEKFDERGNCTWKNCTAKLPEREGEHNEHITQIMRSGQDPISGRKLDSSKPLVFYFDAGEREKEYHPKEGTANLVKATEVFAEAATQKGHKVVDNIVHVLPNGGHHNLTWMRNLTDAAKSMHSPSSKLELTSHAQLLQSLGIKPASHSEKKTFADNGSLQAEQGKNSASELSADIKRSTADNMEVSYPNKTPGIRKK